MGTGKTAVGQKLAERLKIPLVDTDDVIERDSGQIISGLFAQYGEAHFRNLESAAVSEVAKRRNHVISTGGGVVLRQSNMAALKRGGLVFCLTATPEEIWRRVGHERHRPLLQSPDPLGKIRQMLATRAPYYARADYEISTTGMSVEEITETIIQITRDDPSYD